MVVKKDWRYSGFDISEYKMTLATIMAIAFIIPVYAYASGEYVEQSTLVTVGGNMLVDDNLYAMSEPFAITNRSIDDWMYGTPIIYENYLVYTVNTNSGMSNQTYQIQMYDLDEGIFSNITPQNQEYVFNPNMYGNYIVYSNITMGAGYNATNVSLYNILTGETTTLGENMTFPAIYGNNVAVVEMLFEGVSWVYSDVVRIIDITGVNSDIIIDCEVNYTFGNQISENILCYQTADYYDGGRVYNLTYYNIDTQEIKTIECSVDLGDDPYYWEVEHGKIVYSILNWTLYKEFVMTYDVKTGEYTNISVNSPYDLGQPASHRHPDIAGNIVTWANFYNGSWKPINAYDMETENWFLIGHLHSGVVPAYTQTYLYDDGDIGITYIAYGLYGGNIMMMYLNSTANYHPNQIHITHNVEMQNVYDYNIVYGSIISMFVGLAIVATFYNYRDELGW